MRFTTYITVSAGLVKCSMKFICYGCLKI
jgi:hypothetical protein